ncbi:hypothetical protein GW17_00056654 [Ensete ventricosum]|nr:hypothetical protein GW17_00056654 [Ensete ventricosum]
MAVACRCEAYGLGGARWGDAHRGTACVCPSQGWPTAVHNSIACIGVGATGTKARAVRFKFAGDSLKGSGSSLGARREIIERRPDDLSQKCQRLPD